MAEIDDLNTNIQALSADVDTLLARSVPTGVDPAAVKSAADAVAAIDDKIKAVINPA